MNGSVIGRRRLEALQPGQHLNAALHLPRLRGLVAEAFDEPLGFGDEPLLVVVRRLLEGATLLPILQIKGVVTRVILDAAVGDLRDARHHAV